MLSLNMFLHPKVCVHVTPQAIGHWCIPPPPPTLTLIILLRFPSPTDTRCSYIPLELREVAKVLNTRFCWLNVVNQTETMLPPYVIGCTARDVCTWRYVSLCEREESQSTLSVHMSGNYVA